MINDLNIIRTNLLDIIGKSILTFQEVERLVEKAEAEKPKKNG